MQTKWVKSAALAAAAAVLLTGCLAQEQQTAPASPASQAPEVSSSMPAPWMATKNTTRINSSDPYQAAVLVSRTLWPATSDSNRPGGVVLVDPDQWQTAAASANLVHHPNNGPILYAKKDQIPDTTLHEIKRLQPAGVPSNQGVQVILVGEFDEAAEKQLSGYKLDKIKGATPAEMAKNIDAYYVKAANEVPPSVIVGSSEQADFTLPAVNWIAHMPEPLLYVGKDELPKETAEALQARGGQANIYLLGPESVVSPKVAQQLSQFGKVQRIAGKDAYEQAIAFARFKDPATGFGWGITGPGRNLSFVSKDSPKGLVIAAAPFAHLGKHAPLIWTGKAGMPDSVMSYVMTLQPKYTNTPSDGPFNHAWLTGGENDISYAAQGEIDSMLEIASAGGAGHGASHGGEARQPENNGHSGH